MLLIFIISGPPARIETLHYSISKFTDSPPYRLSLDTAIHICEDSYSNYLTIVPIRS